MTSQEIRKQIMGSAGVMGNADELYAEADALYGKQDYAQAFFLAKRAAEQGHPAACSLVGLCFANGLGTNKDVPTARKFFEKAAVGGLPRGKRNFATSLMDPAGGPLDLKTAVEQLTQAIELGDKLSPGILACLYRDGVGLQKDLGKAADLFKRGAEAGDPQSLYELSECYRVGWGVEKDEHAANRLLAEAAERGSESAKYLLIVVKHAVDVSMIEVLGGKVIGRSFFSKAPESFFVGQQVANFLIAQHPVTVGVWRSVRHWASSNGYAMSEGSDGFVQQSGRKNNDESTMRRPVTKVSWFDALKWCNARSEMESKQPCYFFDGAVLRAEGYSPSDTEKISFQSEADGYRLPLEIEWEWAARGGGADNGFIYSGSNDLSKICWSRQSIWVVGESQCNELGIHDMCGHVWQWCWDDIRPRGGDEATRATRGGSYSDPASSCTVAFRCSHKPNYIHANVGFRVARNRDV